VFAQRSEGNQPTRTERLDFAPLPGSSASVWLDTEGRIGNASAAAASMLGYEPVALAGRTLTELAAQDWRAAADVASARVRYGATESFELMLQGRSGRMSLIEMAPQAVVDAQGKAEAFVLTWAHRRVGKRAGHEAVEAELRRLADALLRLREEERMDVATRLHDDLAPTLVMVKYLVEDALQRIGRSEAGDVAGLLGLATARLRGVIADLRSISTDLRPRLLDDLGLIPTLEWYCRGFEEAHPPIAIARALTAAERSVPAALKVEIFRIVQEALGNVARHSQATAVRVSLTEEDAELRLGVEDNGSGFDAVSALRAGRANVGLPSIRKRIEATGGRMILETGPQRGTRIGALWALERGVGAELSPALDLADQPDWSGFLQART
jgi:two-component system NarL family sensor kinase